MRLDKIRQKLYSKQSDIESRKPQHGEYDPRAAEETGEKKPDEDKKWVIEAGTTRKQKTFFFLLTSIFAGAVLVLGGGYVLYKVLKKEFRQQQVQVKVETPVSAKIGDSVNISVSYANYNPVPLRDAHLTLEMPPTFKLESTSPQAEATTNSVVEWNLGEIDSKGNGILEIQGRFIEREEEASYFNSVLRYTPKSISSPFQNEASAGVEVTGIPISISVEKTRTVASGYEIEYKLNLRNNGKEPFQKLEARMEYPKGFTFVQSSPELTGEDKTIWNIPTILSGEEKVLTVRGRLDGIAGERKLLKVLLGRLEDGGEWRQYSEKEIVTTITEPPLSVRQKVKGQESVIAHAEDELPFEVEYANNSERGIGDAVVRVKLEGNIFNWGRVAVERGSFDLDKKEVIWQGGTVPELKMVKPGDKGILKFSVEIPEHVPFTDDKKSNLTGKSSVSIDSPHMPTNIGENKVVTGNVLEIKLGTKVFLQSKGYYNDSTILNEGPVPPTTGKNTTYTIHWTISNIFNELRNVKLKTTLPHGVEWTKEVFPSSSGVEYNERTKEITWNIERVAAGAGSYKPAPNLIFQIKVTPSDNDVGKLLLLINATTLEGVDTFTNETVKVSAKEIKSDLPDDPSISEELGIVIKPGDDIFLP